MRGVVVNKHDALTKIQDLSNGSNIRLEGGIDFDSAAYDTMTFEYDDSDWVETGRNLK